MAVKLVASAGDSVCGPPLVSNSIWFDRSVPSESSMTSEYFPGGTTAPLLSFKFQVAWCAR